MALRVSKGNMYEFVTHTWNAIKGECPHGCSYCYMKRWGKQRPVRFDAKELKTDLGSGNFIFVGSSCDMFAEAIPSEWIQYTLDHCRKHGNQYLFQSKNPARMIDEEIPRQNTILCTTIESNFWHQEMKNAPHPEERCEAMNRAFVLGYRLFVTIEPIMDFHLSELLTLIRLCRPEQVNIGADSGNNHLPEPSREKLLELIEGLQEFTTIHSKRNLGRLSDV